MPINKSTTAPNGAPIAYHVLQHISITPQGAKVTVNSYAAAPVTGVPNKVIWQDTYALDVNEPSWSLASAEAWLITEAGRFAGGTLAPEATPVQQLRSELIATAARRRRELRKVYVHDFGPAPEVEEGEPAPEGIYGEVSFDSDEASSSNILAIVAGPVLAGIEAPGPVEYKCADDVYRSIPFADFRTMAFALSAYVQSLHSRERALIDLIAAAGDDSEALVALAPVVMAFVEPPAPEEEE